MKQSEQLVGSITIGCYGHTLGGPAGLDWISKPAKLSDAGLESQQYTLLVAGKKIRARVGLLSMYDRKNEKNSRLISKWRYDHAAVFIDEVAEDKDPLNLVPGRYKGQLYGHGPGGVFTGSIRNNLEKPRSIFICEYTAADANLLQASPPASKAMKGYAENAAIQFDSVNMK